MVAAVKQPEPTGLPPRDRDYFVIRLYNGTYYWAGAGRDVPPAGRWCRSQLAAEKFNTPVAARERARSEGLRGFAVQRWERW